MKRQEREIAGLYRSPEDIRRKLEGRLEVLEAASQSYAALERLLRSRRWVYDVAPDLGLLWGVARQEPTLQEALAYIRQRARLEHWPESVPALRLAHHVERLRERLLERTRVCLGERELSGKSLVTALFRLEQRVLELPAPETPEEVVLLRRKFDLTPLAVLAGFGILLAVGSLGGEGHVSLVRAVMTVGTLMLIAIWFGMQYPNSGTLWVTQERLVWEPVRGFPIQVPLHALVPGGARADLSFGVVVELEGKASLHFPVISNRAWVVTRLNFITSWEGDAASLIQAIQEMDAREAAESASSSG